MKSYELTYLISPHLSEDELKNLQEKVKLLIQKEGGVLNEIKLPVEKKLSYPIKKQEKAFLGNLSFTLEENKLENLQQQLKSEEKILRFLILNKKLELKPTKPKKKIIKITPKIPPKEKKVELEEIDKKLEEILNE